MITLWLYNCGDCINALTSWDPPPEEDPGRIAPCVRDATVNQFLQPRSFEVFPSPTYRCANVKNRKNMNGLEHVIQELL